MNKMAKALDASPEQLKSFDKAQEYDRLMGLVKSKMNDTWQKGNCPTFKPGSHTSKNLLKRLSKSNFLLNSLSKLRSHVQVKFYLKLLSNWRSHANLPLSNFLIFKTNSKHWISLINKHGKR